MPKFHNYTLAEKQKHWLRVLDKEFETKKKTNVNTFKLKYASNFISASKSEKISKDFNSLDYASQLGQVRGIRAKKEK